jgi:formylglycine-generating enzyme required for sulfatase activity
MVGNVWEWTADEFDLYEGADKALLRGLDMKPGVSYRVMRGGAYDGKRTTHKASYRGLLDASQGYPRVGFRLVMDAR